MCQMSDNLGNRTMYIRCLKMLIHVHTVLITFMSCHFHPLLLPFLLSSFFFPFLIFHNLHFNSSVLYLFFFYSMLVFSLPIHIYHFLPLSSCSTLALLFYCEHLLVSSVYTLLHAVVSFSFMHMYYFYVELALFILLCAIFILDFV